MGQGGTAQGRLPDIAQRNTARTAGRASRDAWLATPAAVELRATLARLATDGRHDLAGFDAALAMLDREHGWVNSLVQHWLELLASHDFADLPWRPLNNAALSGLEVMREGDASCALLSVDAAALSQDRDDLLVFDSGYNRFVVLAGGPLTVDRFRRAADGESVSHVMRTELSVGDGVSTDCGVEQLRMVAAPCDTILLRYSLHDPAARSSLVRAYDLRSGALAHTGCADPQVSRMLALLDVAMAADTAMLRPLLPQLAAHPDPQLRWQAMRIWLTRDMLAAHPRLREMASDDGSAQVRAAARAAQQPVEQAIRDWRAKAGAVS